MLQSENIQSFLQLTGEIMQAWIIIPDAQEESIFMNHKQFVHLSTVCNMLIRNSVRKYWTCASKTLFYLHENFGNTYYSETLRMTEWVKETIINRSCEENCAKCPELSKRRRLTKIECRLRDY